MNAGRREVARFFYHVHKKKAPCRIPVWRFVLSFAVKSYKKKEHCGNHRGGRIAFNEFCFMCQKVYIIIKKRQRSEAFFLNVAPAAPPKLTITLPRGLSWPSFTKAPRVCI